MQIRPDNVLSHRGYDQDSSDFYSLPYPNSGNDAVSGAQHQMNGFLGDLYVSGEDQKHMNNAGIGPQQNENSRQPSPSAGSEQQLDQLLAMFIMMMLQQSQGSDADQECGNEQPQNGQQEGLSPLTQMLMQIVMQLMQNQGGAGMGGGGSVNSSLGGSSLGGGFNANLSSITGQA